MKKAITFIVGISMTIFSYADVYTSTIRGKVVDNDTEMPLVGATVVLLGTSPQIGTITNEEGEFKLDGVEIGRHSIQVSYIGYNPANLSNLLLTSGKELVVKVNLVERIIQTAEVTVKAKINKDQAINKMATVSARSFSVEETERYAGSLGDPSRMAANYAGVSMINDSRNDIVIRGNSPIGLIWRLDGFDIPNPNHFGALGTTGGPVSMLNNNLLTNSDFFTSAFPAEYGNGMSGVFDLKMRSGNNQKREYVGQIGFNGFELGAEGPFKKGGKASYLANFRYSTLEVMSNLGFDVGIGQAVPQYKDLTFKLDFPGTKLGRFSLIGIGGLSYIELHDSDVANVDESEDQNYNLGGVDLDYGSDMGIVGLTHLYYFNNTTRLQTFLSLYGTKVSTYIDSLKFDSVGSILQGSNYQFYEGTTTEVKYSVSTHLKKKFNTKNILKTGVYFDLYDMNYIDSVWLWKHNEWFRSYDYEGTLSLLRAYVQWQHRFTDDLMLNAGIYSQTASINPEITFEPRVGFKYNIDGSQSLNLGYGMHSQLQPRLYYFLEKRLEDGSSIKTNEDLKMSKAHQFVLGYDKLFSENFRFKTEVYYQNLYDIPVNDSLQEFSVLNYGDDFYTPIPDSLVNDGTGRNYGIEFTLEKFLSKGFYFLSTVSLFESKYKGYSGTLRNSAYNNNVVLNLLGGYEFKLGANNSLTFDIKTTYAGGKPYIPIDVDESVKSNETEFEWDNSYENKFGEYFRTDFRIGFKMNGKSFNQEWAVDLQNFTGYKNIYKQAYNPRTQEVSYDYQTGFFPMFLWRIQF